MSTVPSRRRFLLGAGAAATTALLAVPALAKLSELMPPTPKLWGDGIHDDTVALQHYIDAELDRVAARGGGIATLPAGDFRITDTVYFWLASYTTVDCSGARFIADSPERNPRKAAIRVECRKGADPATTWFTHLYIDCRACMGGIAFGSFFGLP